MSAILRGIGKGLAKVGAALAGVGVPERIPLASAEAAAHELFDAWARAKATLLSPVKAVDDLISLVKNQGTPLYVDKTSEGYGLIRVMAVETRPESGERALAVGGRAPTFHRLVFNIKVLRPTGEGKPPREEAYTVVVPGDARLYHLFPLAAIYALNRDRLAPLRFEHPRAAALLDAYIAPLADILVKHYDYDTLRRLAEEATVGPITEERALRLIGNLRTATGTWRLRVYEGADKRPKAFLLDSRGITGKRSGWLWIEGGTPYSEAAPILWEDDKGGVEVKPFNPEFLTVTNEYVQHFRQLSSAAEQLIGRAIQAERSLAAAPSPVKPQQELKTPATAPPPREQPAVAPQPQEAPAVKPEVVKKEEPKATPEKKEEKPVEEKREERLIVVPEAARRREGEKREERLIVVPEAVKKEAEKKEEKKEEPKATLEKKEEKGAKRRGKRTETEKKTEEEKKTETARRKVA